MINKLDKPGLAHRCRKEQLLFIAEESYDPRYCFKLFRLALEENDLEAWRYVTTIFSDLVGAWVFKHGGFRDCGENVEYVIQGTFDRCLYALSGKKLDTDKGLGGLLNYLKKCVHSEIVDLIRKKGPPTVPITDNIPGSSLPKTDPIAKEKLWNFVNDKLKTDEERVVVYATFFLCYHPSQIYDKYARKLSKFKSVKDVSRVKENVFARLRNDSELKQYLDFDYDT